MPIDPKAARDWVRITRDVAITAIAGFMLIYETVAAVSPNPYLIGAGLTLLGIPPALRFDQLFRPRGEDE